MFFWILFFVFFSKQKTAYEIGLWLEFRRCSSDLEQPHNFQVIVGLPENVSKSIESLGILPTEFSVDQNVPNPFNPITSIRVQLVEDARVTMKIFNILGEEVLTLIDNEFMKSGHRQVIWNGRDNFNRQLPSGLYLYQTVILNNQGKLLYMNTNKMIMVK